MAAALTLGQTCAVLVRVSAGGEEQRNIASCLGSEPIASQLVGLGNLGTRVPERRDARVSPKQQLWHRLTLINEPD